MGKKFAGQCKLAETEIMARLPTDKRRAKVEKIESLLQGAVASWYAGISRDRILELLTEELKKRIDFCEEFETSGEVRASICGLDRKEAEAILKSVGVTCNIEEMPAVYRYPTLILETKKVRITASIEKTVEFLLQEKRAELIEALLGRAFMEAEV
jgi:hypothetical protein